MSYELNIAQHKPLGNDTPNCPYCLKSFDKMPGKKSKCFFCGRTFLVRTRPTDSKRVLVTEQDADALERQWRIEREISEFRREYLRLKDEFEQLKSELTVTLGHPPSDNEIFWELYGNQSETHAIELNWGLYRNTRFQMARLLLVEDKLKRALQMLFEVSYLDANGPNNLGGLRDPQLLKRFPPFNPKDGLQAPGILSYISDIVESLKMSPQEMQNEFLKTASEVQDNLKVPLSPRKAWGQIQRHIRIPESESQ